jgi:DNA polymerase III delta prime subunit
MLKQNFFKTKYRPKNLDELVLLPRIRKIIENGIHNHFIFYGPYGMGKTALVELLCKGRPYLELNTSNETGIETLRTKVDDFCSKMSMFDSKDDLKIVYLDEIDGASSAYQDALKRFIEKNERNVRFIATTNYINRIDGGALDRFFKVDFSPQDQKEVKYLKVNYAKRLVTISKQEEIDISPDDIKSIVNKNFPSFRKMLSVLQHIKITGEMNFSVKSFDEELKTDLYQQILNSDDTEKNYHFLMDKFGPDQMDELISLLGRPFIEFIAVNKKDKISKLGDILVLVTKYGDILDKANSADPLVIGTSLMYEIQKELK